MEISKESPSVLRNLSALSTSHTTGNCLGIGRRCFTPAISLETNGCSPTLIVPIGAWYAEMAERMLQIVLYA